MIYFCLFFSTVALCCSFAALVLALGAGAVTQKIKVTHDKAIGELLAYAGRLNRQIDELKRFYGEDRRIQ